MSVIDAQAEWFKEQMGADSYIDAMAEAYDLLEEENENTKKLVEDYRKLKKENILLKEKLVNISNYIKHSNIEDSHKIKLYEIIN